MTSPPEKFQISMRDFTWKSDQICKGFLYTSNKSIHGWFWVGFFFFSRSDWETDPESVSLACTWPKPPVQEEIKLLLKSHVSFFFREEGGEKKKCRCERNIKLVASALAPTRDRTHNLSLGPEWESSLTPVGVQDEVPTIQGFKASFFMPSYFHFCVCLMYILL